MDIMTYFLLAVIVLVAIFAKMALVIIPQSETKIVERLGKYYATLKPGINVIIPFIDRAKSIVVLNHGRYQYSTTIDLREQVYDFPKQNVITKDNVQTEINALLYFQIVDPFKATYEINNLPNAIEKLTQTTLRNIIGELELDETLTSRDTINKKLSAVLDDATDKWGVKVNRVELQDITPPDSVLTAMEKQMQAERNKRAQILTSEGQKAAEILASEIYSASGVDPGTDAPHGLCPAHVCRRCHIPEGCLCRGFTAVISLSCQYNKDLSAFIRIAGCRSIHFSHRIISSGL